MKNDSIARGIAIIALANVATRIIGLLFRIVLVSLAGPGAIGLFQMIFPIYFVVLVLATGGIPTVVAKLVAQYSALRQSSTAAMVVRKALIVCFLSGTVACAVLLSAGLGLMKMASLGTILNSVVSIAGIWFLTPRQGITGTAAVFAVSFVLSGLTLLVIVNGRIKVIRLLLPTIKRALAGGAAAALIWLLIPVSNLFSLLAVAVLSLLVYLAGLWLSGERLQSITV